MRFDLHTHTHYSACSSTEPRMLLKAAKKSGLDGIAVTDHDSFEGALQTKKLNRDKDFRIVLGAEITSDIGHVLCLDISEMIKSRDFHGIVDEARSQGGFVSIAHPCRVIGIKLLKAELKDVFKVVDGIEAFNARTFFWQNNRALRFAEENRVPVTAGSDGHFPFEIGKVSVEAKDDLFAEIRKRKVQIRGTTLYGMIGEVMSVYPKYICGKWKKR